MKIKKLVFKKATVQYILFGLFVLLSALNVGAQTITINGTVKDDVDGMPIPGATVLVKGTSTGTTADFDGVFEIAAKLGDVLEVSFLGMVTKEVTVQSEKLTIQLASDVQGLDEVVVIGYGTVTKKELTGAVSQVKAEELEKIVTSDLGAALQGQAAGVNVVGSSTPGGSSEILIRGITTLGDNTPLYVIDGIIQESDPQINPNDIQTIDILKDAASTAIYGSRGATGVILITTKQGTPGTLQVRLNASYGIAHRQKSLPLMNSLEQTYFDLVTNRNVTGGYDEDAKLQLLNSPYYFQNETDMNDILFVQDAPVQNYNVNISGGTNDITYSVSTGFYSQDGLQLNSGYKRFNSRVNTVYQKNKLRIQTSLGVSTDNRDIPRNNLLSQGIVYRPTQNGLDLDSFNELTGDGDDVNRLGWVLESLRTTQNLETVRTNGSLNVSYEVIDGLKLSANTGFTTYNSYGKTVSPFQAIYNNAGILQTSPSSSYVRMNTNYNKSFSLEVGGIYEKFIDVDNKVTLGFYLTTEKYSNDAFTARRLGATNPDIQVLDGATGEQSVTSGFNYIDKRTGAIARLQYDYKGKYLLSSSIRRDGSSKFPKGKQWGIFPSMALAWNVSDEKFWKNMKKVVNNFKFRVSYGSVGNDRIRSYEYAPGIEQNINYVGWNGTTGNEVLNLGSTQENFANEELQWETTTQSNFGVDLNLFKNKMSISAEYYHSNKENMLFPVFLPLSAGGGINSNVVLNVGNMVNDGFELAMGLNGRSGDFRWRMNGTFSTNSNEITKIYSNTDFMLTDDNGLVSRAQDQSRVTALAVGHEAGAFYLWRTNGIIDTEEKLANYQSINSSARMGDVMFVDKDGDGNLDNDDREYRGSGLPDYEIGYTFNASYKNFDFSMNLYAAIGQEIMNGFNAWSYGFGRHKDLIYQWSETNPVTPIPAYKNDIRRHPNFIGYSDLWLEDGSYLRLRQISLGYSLPKKTLDKLGFSRLRFYVTSQNTFTFTNYSGYNPEIGGSISSRGLDKGTGPMAIQYLAGLNFNF